MDECKHINRCKVTFTTYVRFILTAILEPPNKSTSRSLVIIYVHYYFLNNRGIGKSKKVSNTRITLIQILSTILICMGKHKCKNSVKIVSCERRIHVID